jgi:hypothetical protein
MELRKNSRFLEDYLPLTLIQSRVYHTLIAKYKETKKLRLSTNNNKKVIIKEPAIKISNNSNSPASKV